MKEGRYAIMVNGLPGEMATLVANEMLRAPINGRGYVLCSYAITGDKVNEDIEKLRRISLDGMSLCQRNHPRMNKFIRHARESAGDNLIAVDFARVGQGDLNAELYFDRRIPFVMGTRSVDYTQMDREARASGIPCVATHFLRSADLSREQEDYPDHGIIRGTLASIDFLIGVLNNGGEARRYGVSDVLNARRNFA